MQTKQDTTSCAREPRTSINKRGNTHAALAALFIVSFFISLTFSSKTHTPALVYVAIASLLGAVAFAFTSYFYALETLKSKIEERAKLYVENLDTIYADKRIIGKNLKIVLENSKYNCHGLTASSYKTSEILARSTHDRWIVIEIECSLYRLQGYAYIEDDDYVKVRLKHHRDLYVEYFGEPEVA
jgi:hypothetical protein